MEIQREKYRKSEEREIHFMELAYVIMGTGKLEICRAGW